EAFDASAEAGEICRHVARAAEAFALLDKIDYRDGSFRRKARGSAPKVAVEHQVAKDADTFSTQSGNEALQALSVTVNVATHKEKSGGSNALVCGDGGLFQQHDRDIVANRINATASLAFQALAIGGQLYRGLALRADQNIEQVLRYGHQPLL